MRSTLEENKAGKEELSVWGKVQLKTREEKAPFSARPVGRDRKVGEVIKGCHESQPFQPLCSSSALPLDSPPKSCLPSTCAAASCPSGSLNSPCLAGLFSQSALSCLPRSSGAPRPPSAHPPTPPPPPHRHAPSKQAFTPCFSPPAQFRTS